MHPSRNNIASLQRRALQLEAREHALRCALRQRWSKRLITPTTVAIALTASASLGLFDARVKHGAARHASDRGGWWRAIALVIELGGVCMSLASLLRERHHGPSSDRLS